MSESFLPDAWLTLNQTRDDSEFVEQAAGLGRVIAGVHVHGDHRRQTEAGPAFFVSAAIGRYPKLLGRSIIMCSAGVLHPLEQGFAQQLHDL